jgi:hypothetical protein
VSAKFILWGVGGGHELAKGCEQLAEVSV